MSKKKGNKKKPAQKPAMANKGPKSKQLYCRCSSVVERLHGKKQVASPILACGSVMSFNQSVIVGIIIGWFIVLITYRILTYQSRNGQSFSVPIICKWGFHHPINYGAYGYDRCRRCGSVVDKLGQWWNGIHEELKPLCLKCMRVRVLSSPPIYENHDHGYPQRF